MKKSIYVLLTAAIFITSTGFRGCESFLYGLFGIDVNSFEFALVFGSSDNLPVHYGVAVTDDGKIYTSEGRPPAPWVLRNTGSTRRLNSVKILNNTDSSVTYAVGDSGTVLRSTDKGHTWSNRNVPYQNFPNLHGLDFLPLQGGQFANIIAVGNNGKVVKSENFGNYWNWFEYPSLTSRNFRSVAVINSSIWIVIGSRGAVYRTATGGETWQSISTGDTNSYNKIVQVRYDTYLIAGNNGKIFMSTNYGSSWTPRTSGTTKHLRDALFKNEFEGVVVGDDGTVRQTTNGGATWLADPYLNGLTTRDIISISKIDSLTVNSVTRNLGSADIPAGDTTYFLAVSSEPFIGIEPVSNIIARIFSLGQNFPNPFNPVTNIKISVPAGSFVNLVVYDAAGRVLETLVNNELKAGVYKIDWNALSYPSGVYFYRMTAGEFTETKKMVLLK